MNIVSRAEWGFNGWLNGRTPYTVNEQTQRTEFFVHYEGGNPVLAQTGNSVPRDIHAFHKGQGWKGIGYGHVIDADGVIYEGRGFNMTGSHCPNHNTSGYSVQIHLGGNEKPTTAQLASARWLYEEACRRSGRTLAKRGHRDGFATACPGDNLYAWVRAGMPTPTGAIGVGSPNPTSGGSSGGAVLEEDDVSWTDQLAVMGSDKKQSAAYQLSAANVYSYRADKKLDRVLAQLEGMTAALGALASSTGANPQEIAGIVDRAVRDRLAQFTITDEVSE